MSLKKFQQNLEELANQVEQNWNAQNYETKLFSEIAGRALNGFSNGFLPDLDRCK